MHEAAPWSTMVLGKNTGFHCPKCGVPATWEVDECDACGYRSEAMRGWERERHRQTRRDDAHGCLSVIWDIWLIEGMVYGLVRVGRLGVSALRTIWSLWM